MKRTLRRLLVVSGAGAFAAACAAAPVEDASGDGDAQALCTERAQAWSRIVAELESSRACVLESDCTHIGVPATCAGPIGACPLVVATSAYATLASELDRFAAEYCDPVAREACDVEKLSCLNAVHCIDGQCQAQFF